MGGFVPARTGRRVPAALGAPQTAIAGAIPAVHMAAGAARWCPMSPSRLQLRGRCCAFSVASRAVTPDRVRWGFGEVLGKVSGSMTTFKAAGDPWALSAAVFESSARGTQSVRAG